MGMCAVGEFPRSLEELHGSISARDRQSLDATLLACARNNWQLGNMLGLRGMQLVTSALCGAREEWTPDDAGGKEGATV